MEISCKLAILHAEYVISEKAVSFAFKVHTPLPLPSHPMCRILGMPPPWATWFYSFPSVPPKPNMPTVILIEIAFGGQPEALAWWISEFFEANLEYVLIVISGAFNLILFSSCPISLFRFYCPAHSTIDQSSHAGQIHHRLTCFVMRISSHADPSQSDMVSYPSLKQPKTSVEDSTWNSP